MSNKRIAITGMAINVPLSDTLDGFHHALMAGKSAVSNWKKFDVSAIYSKVGGDLAKYDIKVKLAELEKLLEPKIYKRLRNLIRRAPWSTQLSMLLAASAWVDSGIQNANLNPGDIGVILAGHNINSHFTDQNREVFLEEPDYIDPMYALHSLDTDHAGSVSEVIKAKGPIFTIGGACASGNLALRCAVDEIRHHDLDVVFAVGAVLDFAPIDLHAMALMGAISFESFNDQPERASRPYDTDREGFVPSHGGGVLVVEDLEKAERRGARIYAEVLGVEANADANHLPQPSEEGQISVMRRVFERSGVSPEDIDYINAHATSTPLGDITEIRAIKRVFGDHAKALTINAPKSMLGHTCWSAPIVESIAAIMQMNASEVHPSINIENLDPEVDLDICRGAGIPLEINYMMKNSFGFGGINCVSLFKKYNN